MDVSEGSVSMPVAANAAALLKHLRRTDGRGLIEFVPAKPTLVEDDAPVAAVRAARAGLTVEGMLADDPIRVGRGWRCYVSELYTKEEFIAWVDRVIEALAASGWTGRIGTCRGDRISRFWERSGLLATGVGMQLPLLPDAYGPGPDVVLHAAGQWWVDRDLTARLLDDALAFVTEGTDEFFVSTGLVTFKVDRDHLASELHSRPLADLRVRGFHGETRCRAVGFNELGEVVFSLADSESGWEDQVQRLGVLARTWASTVDYAVLRPMRGTAAMWGGLHFRHSFEDSVAGGTRRSFRPQLGTRINDIGILQVISTRVAQGLHLDPATWSEETHGLNSLIEQRDPRAWYDPLPPELGPAPWPEYEEPAWLTRLRESFAGVILGRREAHRGQVYLDPHPPPANAR